MPDQGPLHSDTKQNPHSQTQQPPAIQYSEDSKTRPDSRGSSSGKSTYSAGSIVLPAYDASYRELGVYLASQLTTNCVVRGPDKQDIYVIIISKWTPHKPDVTVLQGPGEKGAVLGVSNFRSLSSPSVDLIFGDPDSTGAQHQKLEMPNPRGRSAYGFSLKMQGGPEVGMQKRFTWKRTHNEGGSSLSMGNLKLVDEATQDVVAVYLAASTSWKKQGKFQLRRDWGPEWEAAVVTSGMALLEKRKRRQNLRPPHDR